MRLLTLINAISDEISRRAALHYHSLLDDSGEIRRDAESLNNRAPHDRFTTAGCVIAVGHYSIFHMCSDGSEVPFLFHWSAGSILKYLM